MSTIISDVIDHLAGIRPGSSLDRLRDQRPQARENAQKSYLALFEPEVPGNVTTLERFAIATFVAGLHRQPHVVGFYAASLQKLGHPRLTGMIEAEIVRGSAEGPYGRYPQGPLTVEDKEGPVYQVSASNRENLGFRLVAALEHAHLLVFHPRDASPAALQKLLDAGWSTTDIVTLSQLVAFLSFQIRVVVGLRALAGASAVETNDAEFVQIFTGVLASGTV
ncbi:CMD domain protein [Microvirga arsenatis]|uniref:CMD domain protein n=1 Tax=Microvirga arsenatis TaxID=2692265 RepID=A0ABW9Z210_9HYPH|nr:CMD domain protein [Microvirga arsenatis]NBJ12853.1 CMD domain protein [Microvirga arsenatis]NBJ26712.1 CMD domain protein [Microvirga arsenatis]